MAWSKGSGPHSLAGEQGIPTGVLDAHWDSAERAGIGQRTQSAWVQGPGTPTAIDAILEVAKEGVERVNGSPGRTGAYRAVRTVADHPIWVVVAAAFITLVVWGVALTSILSQVGDSFPGFLTNPEGVVSGFTPPDFTGPQAGLRPWDRVVAIEGQRWLESARSVRNAGAGQVLTVTVERRGVLVDVAVPTMVFTADIPLTILPGYFASSLIFLAVGIFVYLRNPTAPLSRYLLAYLLIWAVGGSIVWESYLSQTKVLGWLLLPYAVVAPVLGWAFFWTFPSDPQWRRFLDRVPIVRAFFVAGGVTIVVFSCLRLAAHLLNVPALWRALVLVQGWPYFVVFGLGSAAIKALPLLFVILRRVDRRQRQQAAVMFTGLTLGLTGWYLALWAPAAIHIAPVLRAPWHSLTPAIYPLSIGYAIVRYRFLDISVVVRKGLIYSLLTATLTAGFLLLSLLGGFAFEGVTGRESRWTMVVAALLVAALFQPLRSRIQALVDRAFFRHDTEVRQALSSFSRDLGTLRSQTELVGLVGDTVTRTLVVEGVTLWLAQGDAYVATTDPARRIGTQGPLATWLEAERSIAYPLNEDPSGQAEELRGLAAELAVPLFVGERLTGILTLGRKHFGEVYRQADLELLTMLAQSAALALENARLHEERLELVRQQFVQAAEIQEEERRRIARELHDGVGATLASLNLGLYRVRRQLEGAQNPAAAEVDELAADAQAGIRDIRRLVYDLRPAALDELGLVPALQEYAARYQRDQGVAVNLEIPEDLPRLPAAVETTLFRIAQEALANVAKHAAASRVALRLVCTSAHADLRIVDDGRGFDAGESRNGTHLGLWSMRKRVEQFGGALTIESAPGQGTRVSARIPLQSGTVTNGGVHGPDQPSDRR